MEYRKVNAEGVRSQVRRQHALAKEQEAFTAELELARQKLLTEMPGVAFAAVRIQAAELVKERTNATKDARKDADLQAKAAPLTPQDINAVRRSVLGDWMTNIEHSHITSTELLAVTKGRDKKAKADRENLQLELQLFEAYHALAVEKSEELEAELAKLPQTEED